MWGVTPSKSYGSSGISHLFSDCASSLVQDVTTTSNWPRSRAARVHCLNNDSACGVGVEGSPSMTAPLACGRGPRLEYGLTTTGRVGGAGRSLEIRAAFTVASRLRCSLRSGLYEAVMPVSVTR